MHTVCNVALIHRHQIKYTSPIVKLISIQIQISMVSLVFQIDSVHAFSIYVSMFFGNVSIKEHLEPFPFLYKNIKKIYKFDSSSDIFFSCIYCVFKLCINHPKRKTRSCLFKSVARTEREREFDNIFFLRKGHFQFSYIWMTLVWLLK